MEKLNIVVIVMYLVKIYQCTSIPLFYGQIQNVHNNSVEQNTTSLLFELPKIIPNTGFDIKYSSNETCQNNISTTIKDNNQIIPVLIDKGNYSSHISSDGNDNLVSNILLQFRTLDNKYHSNVEGMKVNHNGLSNQNDNLQSPIDSQKVQSDLNGVKKSISNNRKPKNTYIDNVIGNLDIANSTLDAVALHDEITNGNRTVSAEKYDELITTNPTESTDTTVIENSDTTNDKIMDENNFIDLVMQNQTTNVPQDNVTQNSKTKILNITANLEITLQNNLHKIVGSLKAESGKYLLPHLMEKFETTVLRPIKDTLDTIHIELSPEYNNNYGSQIQPNTPLFLQKLQEKKNKILNHFGIRCCNYDYPHPY